MSDLRALLLTDVVNSTALSEALGDAAATALWSEHDRVARDLLRAWRGREIDKSDGLLVLFDTAVDAVGYALAYHHSLTFLHVPLKARAGIHVGPVILRKNSRSDVDLGAKPLEVDGIAKPTTARAMSLAQGGQTFLTAEARESLGETALQVQSHGHWSMRGLQEPMELFEVGEAGASLAVPPDTEKVFRVARIGERWLPVNQVPNNLPQHLTSFLGREQELSEAKALLSRTRLLTLVGMGGLGKTRLSLQVAAELMPAFPEGVWFLDLAPIRDPALVVSEVARVLEVREQPGRPLLQTLCAHLKSHRVLLILDNCEHLIRASAELANAILRANPQVHVLASSREALHVPGEYAYPIPPLPVPKRDDSIEALSQSTAVRLFVDRAQQHKSSFGLNERNAPAVAELVARLEGIPLALELAAARVRSMAVSEINERLKDRYKLLTGGGSVLLERQQTLRALVTWSYDLLTKDEQAVLNRLGIFVGGFSLAAAELVCSVASLKSDEVLDILRSLVEKSLVMLDEREEDARYRMLETIRDYAREALDQSGDTGDTAVRHCNFYFELAKIARHGIEGERMAYWIGRLEVELDNIRAATTLALNGGVDQVIAVKLAVALQGFWTLRGYATEGRHVVRAALALDSVQTTDQAKAHALYVGAALACTQSDHAEARRMLEACLALRRRMGNPVDIAATLSTLSVTWLALGDAVGAREGEEEALQIFRQLGDQVGEAIGLLHLGQIEVHVGDDRHGLLYLEQCLAVARAIKHRELEGECERVLGEVAFEADEHFQAAERFTRSLAICREAGDQSGEAKALWWLGKVEIGTGSAESARRSLRAALTIFNTFGMRTELLGSLEDCISFGRSEGSVDDAVRLCAATTLSRERLGLVRSPRAERRWQEEMRAMRAFVGGVAFDDAWAQGRGWEIDEAVGQALSWVCAPSTA